MYPNVPVNELRWTPFGWTMFGWFSKKIYCYLLTNLESVTDFTMFLFFQKSDQNRRLPRWNCRFIHRLLFLGLKKGFRELIFFEKKFKKIQKNLMKLVMKQSELEKNRESQLFRQVFKSSAVLSPNKGIIGKIPLFGSNSRTFNVPLFRLSNVPF